MTTAQVSDKGQITLPADIRKRFGLKGKSRVQVHVRDGEIVLRPVRSISDLYGVFHKYAEGKPTDSETVRTEIERIADEEGTGERLNW